MLWANFIEHFKHLLAFISFHTVLHYIPLPSKSYLWSNLQKHLFFWIFLRRNSSLTKTTDSQLLSTKSDCSISLFLISITLHIPSCLMLAKKPNYGLGSKLYCYSSLSHLPWESFNFQSLFVFLLYFSFSLFSLLRSQQQICRVWLTQTYRKVLTKSS